MKRIITFLFIAIASLSVSYAQGVVWESGTLDDALSKAAKAKDGKNLVFLDCYTQWCGPCKKMLNDVFPTKEAGDYFNAKFINIKLDMEAEPNKKHASKYGIKAYPTFLLLNPDGSEVTRVVGGAADAAKFIQRIEEALNPSNKPELLLERYEKSGETEFLFKYFERLEKEYNTKRIGEYIRANFDKLPAPLQFTENFWKYILQSISLDDITILNKVLENKVSYDRMVGKKRVDNDLYEKLSQSLNMYLYVDGNASAANVERACEVLMILSDGNSWDRFIVEIAVLKANGKADDICAAIDAKSMSYFLKGVECEQLLEYVLKMKDISDVDKARFLRDYHKSLSDIQSRVAKYAEKYKDIAISEEDQTKRVPVIRR